MQIDKSLIDKKLGMIFREFRLENKYTQEQIVEKLGITAKYISRIENGTSGVSQLTIINYMNILGISPNTLYASFITNEKIKAQIKISEDISRLSSNQIEFISNMIEKLKQL